MIINIKGCSGSGKSTIVRRIMEQYDTVVHINTKDRKRPIAYKCTNPDKSKDLYVLGHYETACGGCDTIKKMDDVFQLIRDYSDGGKNNVLFEGLLLTADVNRSVALHAEGYEILTIGLSTPLELCLQSIGLRRHEAWQQKCADAFAKGKDQPVQPKPVNPYHTTNKFNQMKNVLRRIGEAGLPVREMYRGEAIDAIRMEFGV